MANFRSTKSLYLAIDQGGHASRAVVFASEGLPVAEAYCDIETQHPEADRVEYEAEAMLASVKSVIKDVMGKLDHPEHIVSAGLATQRSSIACWDKESGDALSPVISWQDRRADDLLQQHADQAKRIHNTTGLAMSAHYGASKMRWCLENLTGVARARNEERLAMGPLASFLAFRLLKGQPLVVDVANASRTLLWSLSSLDWDAYLLDMFDIPIEVLPECVPTRHEFGELDIEGIAIPLRILTGDQSAAMYAFGPLQPDTAYINAGTGAFLSRTLGHYPRYSRRLLTSVIMRENKEATYVLEGTVNGAGSALSWLEHELGISNLVKSLPEWAERDGEVPLFMNGVAGLGSPFWVPDADIRFIGAGEDWAYAMAVLESIVFLLEVNMREMQKLSATPQQIQLTGGLAQLDAFCQKVSDLAHLPVYRPVEQEATARGLAYLLAGCPVNWPESDIGVWFKPQANPGLAERFERWEKALLQSIRRND